MAAVGLPLRELLLIIFVAAAITYLTTGFVRSVAIRLGWVAEIRTRDVHSQPTPRLGGVAMFVGFLSAMFLASQLPALTRGFMPVTPEMTAAVCAATAIVVVGIIDDVVELDALIKLAGQIVAALVMNMLGLSWTLVFFPFGEGTVVVLDYVWSTILTTLFVVLLINAINFVDGLDGLAAGLGVITGGSILLFAMTVLHDQGGAVSAYPPAIIAAGLVGMCLGFLPHNFEPSRIFMGDSGAMLIGLLLAASATSASGKINFAMFGTADMLALLSPILVVAAAIFVPVLDLILAIIRRVSKGQSPFEADRLHLHHRLLAIGHTHRRTVLVLYLWVSVVAFGAVSFSLVQTRYALAGTLACLIAAACITMVPVLRARERNQAG